MAGYENETARSIIAAFPENAAFSIMSICKDLSLLEEIHLKRGEKIFLKQCGNLHIIPTLCTDTMLEDILSYLTGSSLYAHSETISKGYIAYKGGVRVGVCGSAVCEGGRILSVDRIDSLNIRIPHSIPGVSLPILSLMERENFSSGILIYSLPGVGKTTLLRDLSLSLTAFPLRKRVCLIDPRREIAPPSGDCPTLDVYSGYVQSEAIEMAVRTMSPEVIICDEIGGDKETKALLSIAGKGIPVIASAHSGSIGQLTKSRNIGTLHSSGLFDWYVGLQRKGTNTDYVFTSGKELEF